MTAVERSRLATASVRLVLISILKRDRRRANRLDLNGTVRDSRRCRLGLDLGLPASSQPARTYALPRASDLWMEKEPEELLVGLLAPADLEDLDCLERPEELLDGAKVESVGELEQGSQRWVRIAVQELVDWLPGHASVICEGANTRHALLSHVLPNNLCDPSDRGATRAITRELARYSLVQIS